MKNVYHVSTEQHGNMKSGTLRSKNATILQAPYASTLSCSNTWKSNYPHRHVNAIALHIFGATTVKLQKCVISKPNFPPSEQSSNWQNQLRLSSLYPWNIMTSALRHDHQRIFNQMPYFVLQYFELVFL